MTDESRVGESLDADAKADATADAPDDETDEATQDEATQEEAAEEETPAARSEATDEFWQEVGVEPVKVALPRDVIGFTLRAYRPASQVATAETEAAEDDEDDPFTARDRARAAEDAARAGAEGELTEAEQAEFEREAEPSAEDETADDAEDAEELSEEEIAAAELAEQLADQEVPLFLSHRGKLLLFATPEALVSFVHSDAEHDLRQLDTWATLVKRLRPEDVVPTEEDTYELDLVVENLRAGHDAWDPMLLISAGEAARDLGHALRLEPVIAALSPGSPLDDLDEALRAVAAGGISGRFARRRLRRIGAQQASLGWRTVIGKIAAATDWRD